MKRTISHTNPKRHDVMVKEVRLTRTCLTIVHEFGILLTTLLNVAYEAGPIVQLSSTRNTVDQSLMTTTIHYSTTEALSKAAKIFHNLLNHSQKCNNPIVQPRDLINCTKLQDELSTKHNEIETQIFTQSKKPRVPPKSKISSALAARLDSKTRLFCILPRDGSPQEIEDEFFEHFSRFGSMNYYEVVKNQDGILAFGYVQYYSHEDATEALHKSDNIYKAIYSKERTLPRSTEHTSNQRIHPLCGESIDGNIYHLHETTCQKQYEQQQRKKIPDKEFIANSRSRRIIELDYKESYYKKNN